MKLVRPIGTTTEENLRLFACDVSEDVLPLFEAKCPDDKRPRQAIEVARRFARSEVTRGELNAAYSAAYWAARSAAYSAARSAAYWAARSAAYSAAYSRYSNWLVVRLESGE